MKKDSNILIRVDDQLKDEFNKLALRNNVTMSALLTACMADLIKRGRLPMYLYPYLHIIRSPEEDVLNIAQIKRAVEEAIERSKLEGKISKAYLFGSYSRGEATSDSDLDFRIETTDDFSLFDLSRLIKDLEEATNKKVDVASQPPSEMDKDFYNEIRKEEICIYEQP